MFAKKLVTQSMIDAVNQVLGETSEETTKPTQLLDEEKKRMLMEPELDETGFHKAAHAAKKAGQSHFEFQGKKYPATAKSHKEAIEMEEATKIPTATGMRVLGSRYGNSAKAEREKTKSAVDTIKGPKTKELQAMDKEPKKNFDEDFQLDEAADYSDLHKKWGKTHDIHYSSNTIWPKQTTTKFDNEKDARAHAKKHTGSVFMHVGKEKNLKEDGDCVTPAQAKKIADKEVGKHEKGLHKGQKSTVKAESYFTNKLLNSLNEAKSTGTEEIFSDNNMGESEMTDKQKAKREKIVMSMKKGEAGMKQRYGKNWKNVMYATATKQAMKEDTDSSEDNQDELDEASYTTKRNPDGSVKSSAVDQFIKSGGKVDKSYYTTGGKSSKTIRNPDGSIKKSATADFKYHKEEVKKSDVPAFLRKMRGDKPLTVKDVKGAPKDSISHKDNLAKARNEEVEQVEEDVEVIRDKNGHKTTTDMLRGRVEGGKLNSFKNFKVNLVTSGEEDIPKETDKGEDTREKQKITTNPGPVDIKFDDKLGHPTVQSHYSSEHQITHEQVQVNEKVIAGTPGWEKMPKNVKDKSGAVHTPMSRAKDLARKSFKKLKQETMMGKISN